MRTVAIAAIAVVAAAAVPARADERALVFVNDLVGDAKLTADAGAVTSALCAVLGRDKRIEVLCAPDVRQLLAFAATTSMLGTSPAADRLQARLASTRFVVSGRLIAEDKGGVMVSAAIGDKAEGADVGAMFFDHARVTIDEHAAGKASGVLDKLPGVARRLVDAVLAPAAVTDAPPAPLAPAKATPPATTKAP